MVCGGEAETNGEILWGVMEIFPDVHCQPRMVVDAGHTVVFDAERKVVFL